MFIVDTETHIFWWARNHYTTGKSMIYHYTWHEHSAELLVAEMDHAGVDRAFLISYDAKDGRWDAEQKGFSMEDFAGGKKYTRRGWKKYPDRFYWFNIVKDPDFFPTAEIVRADLNAGAAGVKLFPGFIQQPLDHAGILDTFACCAASGGRVLISFEMLRPPETLSLQEYAQQLDEVLQAFPALNLCLLHNGCADPLTQRIDHIYRLMDRHPNLYLSTAFPGEKWDDGTEYPFPNYLRRIRALVDRLGTDRLMWATDGPWFEWAFKYRQAVNAILRPADFLTQSQKEEFMGKTAARLMGQEA